MGTSGDLTNPGLSPIGILILLVMSVLTWILPRNRALVPLFLTACYIPLGQSIVVAGANFQFLRILLLVGWCRAMVHHEAAGMKFTRMDKLFLGWCLATILIGSFAWRSEFSHRVVSQCGTVYTAAGTYFLVRWWIRDLDEMIDIVRILAWMILPLALSMIIEKFTSRNMFAIFGGVPEFTFVREGKLRCQGAFRNPLLAGAFGATLFALVTG